MNPDGPLALGAYVDALQAEITTLRARNRELELEVLLELKVQKATLADIAGDISALAVKVDTQHIE